MVFKTKVTIFTPEIKRVQTGRICDEAVKKVQTDLLNEISLSTILKNKILSVLLFSIYFVPTSNSNLLNFLRNKFWLKIKIVSLDRHVDVIQSQNVVL